MRKVFRYIRPYWPRLAGVLVISLISTSISLWLPYLTKLLVDDALIARNADALRQIAMLFLLSGAAGFVLNVASGLIYTRVSAAILFDMRRDVYEHLQRLSPRFFASVRTGDLMSRINNDIAEIQRVAAETALAWFGNVLFLIGSAAVLVWLDWRLFLVGAAALPVAAWALARYRRMLEARTADLRVRSADIGSFLIDTLQGMRAVVTSAAERREVQRFSRLNDAFVATLMGLQRTHYIAGGLPSLVVSAGVAAVFFYGGWRVVEGTMTLGTLAAFMAYQARIVAPVQALMGLYGALATARVSWQRVSQVLDARPDVIEAPGARALDAIRGDLIFDDVSLSHPRGGLVLEQVSFRAEAGRTLAIVGASGSGKSTIADLAVRLLDPDAGTITLDGHNLRDVRLSDLRQRVHSVEQDAVLFHASVGDNVRYARPDATEADVTRALDAAGLTAFIAGLPEGLRTMVGDRGLALSAGERQRIALARAFLADPAVLILDEPSAALDPVAERQIIDGYRQIMRGRTTILISHRLDLVRSADDAVVLQGARVIERGTPAELEDRHGEFASLFRAGRVTAPSV
ncbi:MAG TPA: ABC transporter ATP-binding protein [Vicinamibacterales bacterium]|nr:ABC transporter ATP-binding protein [Vicinamibacterales bacterium]